MNFLAHLYLAEPTAASRIGNLLPDMVPGPLNENLHPEVRAGAQTHKRVDAFTDTHPVFLRSRARLRDKHGRFSGILTDLFYDHVLARDWPDYHDQPLHTFINRVHDDLAQHQTLMPEPMRPIIGRMIEQGWLRCYAESDGMRSVLGMMSRRFSQRLGKPIDLVPAVDDLPAIDSAITADFAEFFPQLISYIHGNKPSAEPAPACEAGPTFAV